MKVKKVSWHDYNSTDDNNGFIYGVEELKELPDYIEWFESEEKREKHIGDNNFEVEE